MTKNEAEEILAVIRRGNLLLNVTDHVIGISWFNGVCVTIYEIER